MAEGADADLRARVQCPGPPAGERLLPAVPPPPRQRRRAGGRVGCRRRCRAEGVHCEEEVFAARGAEGVPPGPPVHRGLRRGARGGGACRTRGGDRAHGRQLGQGSAGGTRAVEGGHQAGRPSEVLQLGAPEAGHAAGRLREHAPGHGQAGGGGLPRRALQELQGNGRVRQADGAEGQQRAAVSHQAEPRCRHAQGVPACWL
mmetsp:Transcript_44563/g.115301  ORF Transcript_44563/g.115301 Transcript_44563/m.115301 type:complete len:202 (-) Transcript_44563:186-791(-)